MSKFVDFFIATPANNYRPPILSYKAFLAYGLILLLLRFLLGSLTTSGASVDSGTLMELINKERTARNLNSLITNSKLISAATQKSQDMIERDYFAHVDPDGNYVWSRIENAGYKPYKILGENLALDFSTSEGMIKAWIDSPTHRANLLHTDFIDQGLAALWGDYQERYTNLTTSLFGTLAEVKAQSTPAPPPPPPTAPTPSPQPTPTPNPVPTPIPTPTPPPPAPTPQTPPPAPTPATNTSTLPAQSGRASTTQTGNPITPPTQNPPRAYPSVFEISRVVFTLFGILLLIILAVDEVIVYRHEIEIGQSTIAAVARSRSSYHFMSFMLIVLVSMLIWWW